MHVSEKKIYLIILVMLLFIDDIHLYEDIDYVNAIFRTGPRATHVVLAGDLVPASIMLVTPVTYCTYSF